MKSANHRLIPNRNVVAWLLLMSALALHVLDEALTDFLPFYNQIVLDLRDRFSFSPMPTFSFGPWLAGLIILIILGFAISPLVRRGGQAIRIVTTALVILMIFTPLVICWDQSIWTDYCSGSGVPRFCSRPLYA